MRLFRRVLFLGGVVFASLQAAETNPSEGIFIDFESGEFVAPGFPAVTVSVTRTPKEVVFGKVSLKGSSVAAPQDEFIYFSTPAGLLKVGEDVEIQMSYRPLELGDKDSYFFFRIRSPVKTLSYSTWRGSVGFIGQAEVPVFGSNIDRGDYRLEFGIHGKAAIALDNLNIQPVRPANRGLFKPGGRDRVETPAASTNEKPAELPKEIPKETPKRLPPVAPGSAESLRTETNCGCVDRDEDVETSRPRLHQSLTITRIYDTPLRNSYLWDMEDKSLSQFYADPDSAATFRKHLYLHIKEWFCDQDFKQFDTFFKGSDPNMVLKAEGRRPIGVKINVRNGETTWFAEDCRNIREVVCSIALEDYVKMKPGVAYTLTPRNVWNDFKWRVEPGCVFIRSPNEDLFPDRQQVAQRERDATLLKDAQDMEKEKNYIGALMKLTGIPYFSPLIDEAREISRRIRAQIKKDIDEEKKKPSKTGF